jgi:hypothetical protein
VGNQPVPVRAWWVKIFKVLGDKLRPKACFSNGLGVGAVNRGQSGRATSCAARVVSMVHFLFQLLGDVSSKSISVQMAAGT